MDGSKKTMVTSGPYTFQIIDNTLLSRDKTEIYSRNFKIGGTYPDCVNVSVIYENNNPVDACMPNLFSDPECSFSQPLDKGDGTVIMIKTLLRYVYTQLPQNLEIVQHTSWTAMDELFYNCKAIISRSGYTTIMDNVILQKPIRYIPTPGQLEQEYLFQLHNK